MVCPTVSRHIRIRHPTVRDLDGLVSLEHDCFVDYYQPHRFSKSHFKSYLRNERAIFLVATRSSTLIGYVAGHVNARGAVPHARVDSIAVTPSERNHGTGGLLMHAFLKEAKGRRCRAVTLEVAVANENAIRFLSRLGFRAVQDLPAYYSPRHDGRRMKLVL